MGFNSQEKNSLVELILDAMRRKGIKNAPELASITGISRSSCYRLLDNEKQNVKKENIFVILKFLGLLNLNSGTSEAYDTIGEDDLDKEQIRELFRQLAYLREENKRLRAKLEGKVENQDEALVK